MNNRIDVDAAFAYWSAGDPVEAGRVILESIKKHDQPAWAANVLQRVVDKTGVKSIVFENVLLCAKNPENWSGGHKAFSLARGAVLRLEENDDLSSEQELLLCVLLLAEVVAKVAYNAAEPVDEFDEDSGWWVAACLKEVLELLDDDQFSEVMWTTLCLSQRNV